LQHKTIGENSPFFLINPACFATPTSVPVVSNRSTNKKANIIPKNPISSAPFKSKWNSAGDISGGAPNMPLK